MKVLTCLTTDHDLRFVAVAALVCLMSSIVAFRLYARAQAAAGRSRWGWVSLTGFAAGAGTWATHFIAMLAYEPGFATGYLVSGTLLSLLFAAVSAAAGFALAASPGGRPLLRRALAGALIGAGVGLMHYTGMAAFRTQGIVFWQQGYVAASLLIGAGLGALALVAGGGGSRKAWRVAAGPLLLTAAISGLHFTAMAAVAILPDTSRAVPPGALSHGAMVLIVSSLALLIIAAAVGMVVVDEASRGSSLRTLRGAIDALPEGMAYFDPHGRCVIWNQRYADLAPGGANLKAGFTLPDLLRKGLAEGRYPVARGREDAWLAERLARNAAPSGPVEHRLADGTWLRVEERRTPDGGTAAVCVDVTELKRREASFRLMFENNPAPMWLWDQGSFAFVDVNAAAQRQYGWSREQFLGMSVFDVLAPEEHEFLHQLIAARAHGGYVGERVWRHRRADGSEIDVRPYTEVFPRPEGPAILAALFDVTDQVAAEAELRSTAETLSRAKSDAEAANRAKSQFLANMSHEIRTPLNGVIGVADILSGTPLDGKQQEMVEIVRSSAASLERLLSDVLDLARVESGRLDIQSEAFDLDEVVSSVAGWGEVKAGEKQVKLRVETAAAGGRRVLGDPGRLRQILANLVSNAVKFTEAGEVVVAVEGPDAGDEWRFHVSDTGIGFDEETRQTIFERFRQADGSITRRYGGSGLGLAISSELARLMGGEMSCESTPGQGSVFTLALGLPPAAALEAPSAPSPPESGACERLHILLADDHPTNRKVVEMMLAMTDAELVMVENGLEACEAVEARAFDLILMDMQMPVMDGLTANRRIRQFEAAARRPRTPIIMLTANAMPEHVRASHASGADRHVAKPVQAQVLFAAIHEVVNDNHAAEKVA
ncbi:MAG TPA: ATP-binding protein [Caulobacteraceae bacterium]